MAEKLIRPLHEQELKHAQQEHLPQRQEREITQSEREHGAEEHVEAHRAAVEKHAKPAHETHPAHHEKPAHHPVIINKHLKDVAYTRSMTRVRKKLALPDRAFSKVVHAPLIERSSDFVGRTVARPSSMLGGSFFALIGTSLLLWITRRYGYEYNYLAVIMLFAIGFAVGISAEALWRMRKNK